MKRLTLLIAGVFVVSALGTTTLSTATGSSRPLGHVVGDFTAEVEAFQPFVLGTFTVQVNAFDRTIDPNLPPFTPTEDEGTLTVTTPWGQSTQQVVGVQISEDGTSATLYTSSFSVYVLHDGGVPGNEIVGPPRRSGLSPTRDWFTVRPFANPLQTSTGWLTSGNINIKRK
jgi:hypothetical protein